MNTYERIFGSGPRGALIGTILFVIIFLLEDIVKLPKIVDNSIVRFTVFFIFSFVGIIILCWSLKSLPVNQRGKSLITTGAYHYFRHPLYAAFSTFINIGVSFLLNNWIYIVWTVTLFPVWALNVKQEEALMRDQFGNEYEDYCKQTWRFFPKITR
ncbi:MAG: isoprenylcysteine carboxylmethyltransferase family protein [Candidatus Margulisbacteria bacterium]|nr:isoprenylcysteine carboxylmethyltransferase family protein [Candidatus Margulisiibacteriota bacterium]